MADAEEADVVLAPDAPVVDAPVVDGVVVDGVVVNGVVVGLVVEVVDVGDKEAGGDEEVTFDEEG